MNSKEYRKWTDKAFREMKKTPCREVLYFIHRIEDLHEESKTGHFTKFDGQEVCEPIENRELSNLIFLTAAENWLGYLAVQCGRMEDGKKHYDAYGECSKRFIAATFPMKKNALPGIFWIE